MRISINGNDSVQPAGLTISELLAALRLPETGVLVECNREPVGRTDYRNTRLAEGDAIEIVQMVAGG